MKSPEKTIIIKELTQINEEATTIRQIGNALLYYEKLRLFQSISAIKKNLKFGFISFWQ